MQRLLMIQFFLPVILSLLMVVLFETDALEAGCWAGSGQKEFACLVAMELLTICCIPLSLRLFKFKNVAKVLKGDGAQAFARSKGGAVCAWMCWACCWWQTSCFIIFSSMRLFATWPPSCF